MLYHRHQPFKVVAVGVVEGGEAFAVDVEDGDNLPLMEEGDDNLAPRFGTAGDMAGELLHVGHDEGAFLRPGCPAHSATAGDMYAGQRPLKGTEQQLALHYTVEPCPPEVEGVVEQGGHIGHFGDEVALAGTKAPRFAEEPFVCFGFRLHRVGELSGSGALCVARGGGCGAYVEAVPRGAAAECGGAPVVVGAGRDVGAGEDDGVAAAAGAAAAAGGLGAGVGVVLDEAVAGGCGVEVHEDDVAAGVLDGEAGGADVAYLSACGHAPANSKGRDERRGAFSRGS